MLGLDCCDINKIANRRYQTRCNSTLCDDFTSKVIFDANLLSSPRKHLIIVKLMAHWYWQWTIFTSRRARFIGHSVQHKHHFYCNCWMMNSFPSNFPWWRSQLSRAFAKSGSAKPLKSLNWETIYDMFFLFMDLSPFSFGVLSICCAIICVGFPFCVTMAQCQTPFPIEYAQLSLNEKLGCTFLLRNIMLML